MEYDKVNGDVGFLEKPHLYVNLKDNTIKYTSVTTLIEKYVPEFDSDWMSSYKALERMIPMQDWKKERGAIWKNHKIPKDFLEVYEISDDEFNKVKQNILDEWAETNRLSCERGTKIHAKFENAVYNAGDNVTLKRFGIGGKFVCKKNYSELDMEYGVYPEYLIYYDNPKINLHIAGQIDLLIKSGNNIIIGDYKTNKELKFKGYYNNYSKSESMMKYPLTNISDCNFNHYQLQLSTYAWMIQKLRPEFNIERLFIYHIDHNNNQNLYEVQYLKDDVEKMLKHFAKQQKLKELNSKYERIEY